MTSFGKLLFCEETKTYIIDLGGIADDNANVIMRSEKIYGFR